MKFEIEMLALAADVLEFANGLVLLAISLTTLQLLVTEKKNFLLHTSCNSGSYIGMRLRFRVQLFSLYNSVT